jgi:hypothetical protein
MESFEWKLAEFEKLVKDPARIKQLYDIVQIGDGKFLNNIKNSFDGLRFGFGIRTANQDSGGAAPT